MTEKVIKIVISLDDESKSLLKASAEALKGTTAKPGAAKPGAAKPGAAKPGKGKAKPAEAEEDFEGEESEEGEGEESEEGEEESEDGEGEEEEEGEGEGEEEEEGEGEDEGPSLDDVGQAMKAFATGKGPGGKGSRAAAMTLLKKYGKVDKLSSLKPANFAAVIKAMEGATAKLKKKAA